ncbi:hypothetical protein D3C72_2107110 [compost metagenome]
MTAPSRVEIATAGSVILIEFQKKPCMPLHSTPVQASAHALLQAPPCHSCGSASILPSRMSSSDLNEVVSITYSGSR